MVHWTPGFAEDNCGAPSIWCSEQPGAVFPVGQWPITCRAYDSAGNTEECNFWIDVVDLNRLYVEVELALTPPAVSPAPALHHLRAQQTVTTRTYHAPPHVAP